jgi:hypothetical protein
MILLRVKLGEKSKVAIVDLLGSTIRLNPQFGLVAEVTPPPPPFASLF